MVARAKGKLRDKQPKLSAKQQTELRRMHATGDYSIADLAELRHRPSHGVPDSPTASHPRRLTHPTCSFAAGDTILTGTPSPARRGLQGGTGRFRDDRKQLQSHITLRRVTGTSPERRAHFRFLPAPRSRPGQNRPENTADTIIPGTAAQPGEGKASMARHRGHPAQDQLNDHTGLHTPRSLRLCRSASTTCTATTTA